MRCSKQMIKNIMDNYYFNHLYSSFSQFCFKPFNFVFFFFMSCVKMYDLRKRMGGLYDLYFVLVIDYY